MVLVFYSPTAIHFGIRAFERHVLDGAGHGVISDVIAALDYAVANKATYNIRVINLSVGAKITESYKTDPLCQAVEAAWKLIDPLLKAFTDKTGIKANVVFASAGLNERLAADPALVAAVAIGATAAIGKNDQGRDRDDDTAVGVRDQSLWL